MRKLALQHSLHGTREIILTGGSRVQWDAERKYVALNKLSYLRYDQDLGIGTYLSAVLQLLLHLRDFIILSQYV